MRKISFYTRPFSAFSFLRWSIGVLFLWFGAVKFIPGLSPAEDLASSTICALTADVFSPTGCLIPLAFVESLIGIFLILGRFLKLTLGILFLHMLGTLLTFFIFPDLMFTNFPFVLSMEGQYVMKNIIIIAAGITIWISEKSPGTINYNTRTLDDHPTP